MSKVSTARTIDDYLKRLFPLQRSLTGRGNRETLTILTELLPLTISEYPSGTQVYDWVVPDEWNIHDAWISDSNGTRLVDYKKNNLHVVGYSEPISENMTFEELDPRLHHLPALPDAIPYRTSYYNKDWGFCVTAQQYETLKQKQGLFEVVIDSEFLPDGSMSIGELYIEGNRREEYLVSTYICHPSMANDNLSGILTTALLARNIIDSGTPEYSWRFVFVPETIGALAYLKQNEDIVENVKGGLVITCCGGPGRLGYKESYCGDHVVDKSVRLAFRDLGIEPIYYPFAPSGSDERQYSSPGFRIPVVSICKDKYHDYREYHTSLDDLDFVTGEQISQSLDVYTCLQKILDNNRVYRSNYSKGEPNLGKRGLYPKMGGGNNQLGLGKLSGESCYSDLDAINWLLFLADGENDLVTTAELSNLPFDMVEKIANRLYSHKMIDVV